jgi:hypothetical protein
VLVALTLSACGAHAPEVVRVPSSPEPVGEEPAVPAVVRVVLVQGVGVAVPATGVVVTLRSSKRRILDDAAGRREVSSAELTLVDGGTSVDVSTETGPFEALGRRWVLHGEAGSLELSWVPPGAHVKP